jgi:hypothetical protein
MNIDASLDGLRGLAQSPDLPIWPFHTGKQLQIFF